VTATVLLLVEMAAVAVGTAGAPGGMGVVAHALGENDEYFGFWLVPRTARTL
jgi:hypothetical protein